MTYLRRNFQFQNTVAAPGVNTGTAAIPVAVNPAILSSNIQLARVMQGVGNEQQKENNDPSVTSPEYDRMIFRTFLMEAILGGTETMRAAGKMLLPMYTGEKQADWQTRLSQAVLYNYTERTSSDLSNRLFKTPPKVPEKEDGAPEQLLTIMQDTDGEGKGIEEFLRYWFRRGFELGMFHVLVTTPQKEDKTGRDVPTWSFIHPDNLIFAQQDTRPDGTKYISHARILGSEESLDGFVRVSRRTITVIEPGVIRVYVENLDPKSQERWVIQSEVETDWDEVPLVTFYSNRTGFMEALPVLQDLAFLNVRHWQSYSDQVNILTVARFPILAAMGTTGTRGSTTISPKKLFKIPDPQGDLKYVEHTGAAIKAGADDLEQLEAMMANYGSEFLKSGAKNQPATARALDSAESTSMLTGIAVMYEDAVHELFTMTMKAFESTTDKDLEDIPRVEFIVDLTISQTDSTELTTLDLARRRRDISNKGYMQELSRRDILADTFDFEDDQKQLEKEIVREKELGIFVPNDKNPNSVPSVENREERAASGESSRGAPDNGSDDTGEGDDQKDKTIAGKDK